MYTAQNQTKTFTTFLVRREATSLFVRLYVRLALFMCRLGVGPCLKNA